MVVRFLIAAAFLVAIAFGCNKKEKPAPPVIEPVDSTKRVTYPYTDTFNGVWIDTFSTDYCLGDTTQNASVYVLYVSKDSLSISSNVMIHRDCSPPVMWKNMEILGFLTNDSSIYQRNTMYRKDRFTIKGDSMYYYRFVEGAYFLFETGNFVGKK